MNNNQPTANNQQSTTNNQQPTINNQQPINQPTNQPTHQPTNQPTNQQPTRTTSTVMTMIPRIWNGGKCSAASRSLTSGRRSAQGVSNGGVSL